MSNVEERSQHVATASMDDVLHTLWKALESSPLPKALSDPLPFELPPGMARMTATAKMSLACGTRASNGSIRCTGGGPFQRHLMKFSHQGDMLFPEEYITHMIDKEEREWREWEQSRAAISTDVNTIGKDDDDDDDDDIEDVHYPNAGRIGQPLSWSLVRCGGGVRQEVANRRRGRPLLRPC